MGIDDDTKDLKSRRSWDLSLFILLGVILFSRFAWTMDSSSPLEICNKKADHFLLNGEWQEAIVLHETIIKERPDFALAHYHLGFAYGQIDYYDQEVLEYRKAISLGLKKAEMYYNLGIVLGEILHDYPEAIAAFQEAVRLKPDGAEFHYNLGLAYLLNKEAEAAEKELKDAILIEPKHIQARISLGGLYADREEFEKAKEEWEEALGIDPSNAIVLANLRWLKDQMARKRS
ncbi:MAG: tetratricopeptide repeat protein (plasmid) [Candidatus Manganitrophus sp.]|nr:tetratricopeptide repeat protein [Candidatus Manganitrophus sp.]WDT82968.1 MAG: tetratricopeptide repeat protein [Candidatus Manganitrophus sp.]